jgi:glyoxylase-like metal-dependent hydrolase (beta-lactamase superfamily II)
MSAPGQPADGPEQTAAAPGREAPGEEPSPAEREPPPKPPEGTPPEGTPPEGTPAEHRRPSGEEQAEQAAAALAHAAAQGIHCLAIPTPFAVGRVNAYLIEDDPLTLIDSGPNSAKALDELEQALAARGHAIEDVELLVVTHQHIDHFGLAAILARRSGAQVAALRGLDRKLARFREDAELDDRFAGAVMLSHGVPSDVVTALRAVSASFRAWGSTVEVTRTLDDGEELKLRDRTLRVLHRPGHSPSDTVFWDERRALLIAGDHLLGHISSNPLLARPLEAQGEYEGPRPQALVTYLDSLARTRAMSLELVLGGHGAPVVDHTTLIDERMRLHERRAERIFKLIAAQPRTAYEMASEMWGNVAVTQAYLTISEVLGHVDLLLNAGRVVEAEDDGVVRFAAG